MRYSTPMANSGRPRGLRAGITEAFASAWVLLSDTDAYLARTSAFGQYEAELMRLRARLQAAAHDNDAQSEARRAIVKLRKSLRLQGHDLSLGRLDLAVKGFRSDDSLATGFRRLVLVLGKTRTIAVSGQDNHAELHARAEREAAWIGPSAFGPVHFLWYRWTRTLLEISGADSEPKEAFEEFKEYSGFPDNRLRVIAALKSLR
jgi:hypothetical protein